MYMITKPQAISAGVAPLVVLQAVAVARQIYVTVAEQLSKTPQDFISATKVYNQIGRDLGKALFEMLHPDI